MPPTSGQTVAFFHAFTARRHSLATWSNTSKERVPPSL